jgi:hypothetical protein
MLTVEAGDDKLVQKFTCEREGVGVGKNQMHGHDSDILTFLGNKESQKIGFCREEMFHYFGSINPFSGMEVEKVSLHICRTTQKRTIPSTTKILCNAIRKRVDVMRSQGVEMKH